MWNIIFCDAGDAKRTKTPTSVAACCRKAQRTKTPTSVAACCRKAQRTGATLCAATADQDTHLRRGVLPEGPTDRDPLCAATETSTFVISLPCD